MIRSCDCKHSYQDKKYGAGRRVHNEMKDTSKCRCTVCGTVRSA